MLPWSLRFMADVRAARTEEKIGHSGRDDREAEERARPFGAGLRLNEPSPQGEEHSPFGFRSGRAGMAVPRLLEDLLEADVDYVAEFGRARGQLGEIQEVGVKGVVTGWRRIDCAAAFEDSGGILRIEQADH
jgi:hypothetical protein